MEKCNIQFIHPHRKRENLEQHLTTLALYYFTVRAREKIRKAGYSVVQNIPDPSL